MTHFDLSPLYRTTVGFDQFADLLDRVFTAEPTTNGYPPFNIEKSDNDEYSISIAVAGFKDDELNVEVRHNQLMVRGRKSTDDDKGTTYLHRGIATRAFEKKFQLADYMRVIGADHVDGILRITLAREVPEALKPRTIAIGKGKPKRVAPCA